MKQQVKISKVKGNPNNPRVIKNDKFKKLVKSIQEFPEMLKLRPIVVDEDFMVLGGNMRLKASKDAGLKEVWIEVAEGLTEEQKKEFIVKDNVGFGEWEWDMLANEWDSVQLAEWGLDVWQNEDDVKEDTLLRKVDELNNDPEIDGFIVQLPLPSHIKSDAIINEISAYKAQYGFSGTVITPKIGYSNGNDFYGINNKNSNIIEKMTNINETFIKNIEIIYKNFVLLSY